MDQATTAHQESKSRPALAPILSLAEHLRLGTFTVAELAAGITTGEPFTVQHKPKAAPALRSMPGSSVWVPRKLTKRGQRRFVQIEDRLWLAILNTRLSSYVAFKVLLAVVLKDLSHYRRPDAADDPVPIGIEELSAVTGFEQRRIYEALKQLEKLHIIDRSRGGGRKQKNSYWVNPPEDWLCG